MKISPVLLAALVLTAKLCANDDLLLVDKEHSHVEAAIKTTIDNFSAKLTLFEAAISVDPVEKRVSHARFIFHFSDVKTGNEKRDKEMLHWEQADQFPDCVYTLENLEPVQGAIYNAHGKFVLHGITQALTGPVTIQFVGADSCTIDGELPLDTRDYGLPVIKKFALLKVNPVLTIKFHLEGHLAPKS